MSFFDQATLTCPACKGTYPNAGTYRNHVKNNPNCTEEMRFWAKVDKNGPSGCWLWTGIKNERGYGLTSKDGNKNYRAHRFSWELVHGPTPSEKFCLHKCDVRNCVNPDHLFLGSYKENADDMNAKGRDRYKGERNTWATLTDAQVLEIRARATGKRGEAGKLAKLYGVRQAVIGNILARRSWKHLP